MEKGETSRAMGYRGLVPPEQAHLGLGMFKYGWREVDAIGEFESDLSLSMDGPGR